MDGWVALYIKKNYGNDSRVLCIYLTMIVCVYELYVHCMGTLFSRIYILMYWMSIVKQVLSLVI